MTFANGEDRAARPPGPSAKSAGAGAGAAKTASCSRCIRYVELCVWNKLTAAMSRVWTPARRAAHSARISWRRYQTDSGSPS